MPLWSNKDEAESAPKHTVDIVTGNTGVQAYNVEPVGTWGVDANEAQLTNVNGHAGWVLRTVGSGGREGRVTEETLVAMGSMTGDGEDDPVYPDVIITITEQPEDQEVANTDSASFSVDFTVQPEGSTADIQWQESDDDGSTWADLDGETDFDLVVGPVSLEDDGTQYRAVITSGDATATSDAATLTVVELEEENGDE